MFIKGDKVFGTDPGAPLPDPLGGETAGRPPLYVVGGFPREVPLLAQVLLTFLVWYVVVGADIVIAMTFAITVVVIKSITGLLILRETVLMSKPKLSPLNMIRTGRRVLLC